jgi:hypothetical protein
VSSFYFVGPNSTYTVHGHQTFTVGWGYNKMLITSKGVSLMRRDVVKHAQMRIKGKLERCRNAVP